MQVFQKKMNFWTFLDKNNYKKKIRRNSKKYQYNYEIKVYWMCEKSLECWGSCLLGVTSYRIGKGWVDDETDHFGWVGPSWYICSSSWRWCFTHHFMTWSMKKYTWMTDLWPNKQNTPKMPYPPLKQEIILCWARWYLILNIQLLTGEDTAHASRCFDIPSNDILSFNTAIENWSRPHTVLVTTAQHFCR